MRFDVISPVRSLVRFDVISPVIDLMAYYWFAFDWLKRMHKD